MNIDKQLQQRIDAQMIQPRINAAGFMVGSAAHIPIVRTGVAMVETPMTAAMHDISARRAKQRNQFTTLNTAPFMLPPGQIGWSQSAPQKR